MKKKVVVGLSGGVDSACTAYLLHSAGYEVIGCSIWMHEYNNFDDAEKIAHSIGIQYKIIDRQELFQQEVKDHFIKTYKLGMTPNPCVKCNRYVKFKTLFDVMLDFDADFVATGHYARVNNSKLMIAFDKTKDQSYFLYSIPKNYFEKILFPLGDYLKSNVKELSKNFSDFLSKKVESQDICFLRGNYKECFDSCTGDIINDKGDVLGKHNGIFNYTIGQRKGLGVSYSEPLFVKEVDSQKNTVIVASKIGVQSCKFCITSLNLLDEKFLEINNEAQEYRFKIKNADIKVRYSSKSKKGDVYISEDFKFAEIYLHEYESGIAKGQSAVVYIADQVILGGIISKVFY